MSAAHSHHNHDHSHSNDVPMSKMKLILALIIIFAIIEIIGGLLSNSLALLSDAGHMVADGFAIFLSLLAFYFARKPKSEITTFGFHRAEILAAFVNGLLLVGYSVFILIESWERFKNPLEINSGMMFWVGLAGLIINIISAKILHPVSKDNLNTRGAYLHILGDLLGSVGVLIAALFVKFFQIIWVDPLVSLFITVLIVFSAYNLIRETFLILMEGVPSDIQIESVKKHLNSNESILDVHDLHIWSLTSGMSILTAHLLVDSGCHRGDCNKLIEDAQEKVKKEFGIGHCTFQIEFTDSELQCQNCDT